MGWREEGRKFKIKETRKQGKMGKLGGKGTNFCCLKVCDCWLIF